MRIPCFTPMRSPESNVLASLFVNTLKRDYVHRPDAKIIDRDNPATTLCGSTDYGVATMRRRRLASVSVKSEPRMLS